MDFINKPHGAQEEVLGSHTGYHSDVPVGRHKTTTLSVPPAVQGLFLGIVVAKEPDIYTAFSFNS